MSRDLSCLKYSKNVLHKCLNSAKLLPTDSDSFDNYQSSILGVHHFFFLLEYHVAKNGIRTHVPLITNRVCY